MQQDETFKTNGTQNGKQNGHATGAIPSQDSVFVKEMGVGGHPADKLIEFPSAFPEWSGRTNLTDDELLDILEMSIEDMGVKHGWIDWDLINHRRAALKVSLGGRGRDQYAETVVGMKMTKDIGGFLGGVGRMVKGNN